MPPQTAVSSSQQAIFDRWYHLNKWECFEFQQDCLEAMIAGRNGLLNAPTGSGKTYACFIPQLVRWMDRNPDYRERPDNGLQLLWISPLRALAKDIRNALQRACEQMEVPWKVGIRNGDTPASERSRQQRKMPEILVITPESLHLLMALKDNRRLFRSLECVVVDEWHELIGTKRGVQTELGLAYLQQLRPEMQRWAISATIGNIEQAAEVIMGANADPKRYAFIRSSIRKEIEIHSIFPDEIVRYPWGGHLGIRLLPKLMPIIEASKTTLVFTNTRSQAEIWYQSILDYAPELAGAIAMHHGSVDKDMREWVEEAIHDGLLKAVICTSSLDLGVDFRPVETVVQVGGPKGVARFLQRAGRSGHRPGEKSVIHFLPTNALELMEAAALRQSTDAAHIEARLPVQLAYDVLAQFLVTLAVGEGLEVEAALAMVRSTHAYAEIADEDWNELLEFLVSGGKALSHYDDYRKIELRDGKWRVLRRQTAMRHRMNIGTIVSTASLQVRFLNGRKLGNIEEYFISRLQPGNQFVFAGQLLELIRVRDMTVQVRPARKKKRGAVPQWMGGRMPLSSQMSEILREQIDKASRGVLDSPEMQALEPIFNLQQSLSMIPSAGQLLMEYNESDEGCHLFVFPFEGRFVHEVLSAVLAYRIGQLQPSTFSLSFNDYGFELMSDREIPVRQALKAGLFTLDNLLEDIQRGINAAEMARRTFRDIACISGLIFQGYPGRSKKMRHLQSSTGLIFEVFSEFEPDHILLRQAYEEVFFNQFEEVRLRKVLQRINQQDTELRTPRQTTPFAFPIMVERLRESMTTESLEERVRRMTLQTK